MLSCALPSTRARAGPLTRAQAAPVGHAHSRRELPKPWLLPRHVGKRTRLWARGAGQSRRWRLDAKRRGWNACSSGSEQDQETLIQGLSPSLLTALRKEAALVAPTSLGTALGRGGPLLGRHLQGRVQPQSHCG